MTPLQPGPLSPGMVSLLTAGRSDLGEMLYEAFWKRNGGGEPTWGDQADAIRNMWNAIASDAEAIAFRLVEEAAQGSGSSAAPIPTELAADRWADLERLAKAATPGPWQPQSFRADQSRVFNVLAGPSAVVARVHEGNPRRAEPNAAFIAAANPSTVLELIAAARAKEEGE